MVIWLVRKERNFKFHFPLNIYLIKVSNKNFRKKFWNIFKVNQKRPQYDVIDVLLVSLLLTLNKFHPFIQSFIYLLLTGECLLGYWARFPEAAL